MTTTTTFQDALKRIQQTEPDPAQIPALPYMNFVNPSVADLVRLAEWMNGVAHACNVTAAPGELSNPFASIGALRVGTENMLGFLKRLQAEEERNLLLMDRLRHEHAQECAHEKLMAEDDEYADEFEADAGVLP